MILYNIGTKYSSSHVQWPSKNAFEASQFSPTQCPNGIEREVNNMDIHILPFCHHLDHKSLRLAHKPARVPNTICKNCDYFK